MRTIAVTGSASGIGAATKRRLGEHGARVIGVDLRDADVVADPGAPDGRALAVAGVTGLVGDRIDRLVTCAGVAGLTGRPGRMVASVNRTRGDRVIGNLVDALPLPVGRSGSPDEIAAVVAFLLGSDARFVCGSVLFCDGGTDAQLRAEDFPAPMS